MSLEGVSGQQSWGPGHDDGKAVRPQVKLGPWEAKVTHRVSLETPKPMASRMCQKWGPPAQPRPGSKNVCLPSPPTVAKINQAPDFSSIILIRIWRRKPLGHTPERRPQRSGLIGRKRESRYL